MQTQLWRLDRHTEYSGVLAREAAVEDQSRHKGQPAACSFSQTLANAPFLAEPAKITQRGAAHSPPAHGVLLQPWSRQA